MPAPLGNNNASKAKVWTSAIERALAARSKLAQKEAIDDLAEKLLLNCDSGDMTALKELGDRLEGRPAQSLALSGSVGLIKAADLADDELANIAARSGV